MKKSILKGFTMIELLIVIAVLGVLAIAVLSAINPIEQINRSRDTGNRADAEQVLGAIDRYYTSMGWYPWFSDSSCAASCGQAWLEIVSEAAWDDDVVGTPYVLTKLSQTGTAELKAAFTTRITGTNYNKLFVYNRGTSGDATYVCFKPASSAFQTEAANRCDAARPIDFPPDAAAGLAPCSASTGNVPADVMSCLP